MTEQTNQGASELRQRYWAEWGKPPEGPGPHDDRGGPAYIPWLEALANQLEAKLAAHIENEGDECQEWEMTYNFLLGQSSGVEGYSRYLRQASGDLFAQGKDAEARIYRDLADDAKARSIRLRMDADTHKARYEEKDD